MDKNDKGVCSKCGRHVASRTYFSQDGRHVEASNTKEARLLLFGCQTDATIYSYDGGWRMHYKIAMEREDESLYTPKAIVDSLKRMIEEEEKK